MPTTSNEPPLHTYGFSRLPENHAWDRVRTIVAEALRREHVLADVMRPGRPPLEQVDERKKEIAWYREQVLKWSPESPARGREQKAGVLVPNTAFEREKVLLRLFDTFPEVARMLRRNEAVGNITKEADRLRERDRIEERKKHSSSRSRIARAAGLRSTRSSSAPVTATARSGFAPMGQRQQKAAAPGRTR